ncbi:hypothetical protein LCGC14_1564400 [marine sediment metagenome]|uniref:Uncharacterized protein n=1 Tax=marine sediment metagenome TaxID=412755 RepID=A0A0F9ILH6_9ZZZZ
MTEQEKRTQLINGMTNWQNTLWMRDGAPKGLDDLKYYANIVHPHHPKRGAYQAARRKHLMQMGVA